MLSVLKAATIVSAAHNLSTIYNKNCHRNYKVCVIGAAGGIGQPLSLLLKMNPMVSHLALYDLAPLTPGVAVDISHMDRAGNVTGHRGPEQLCQALMYSNLVICPAGLPRKPGMSRDDLFKTNASIIRDLACAMVRYAPCAILAIITNPVNSMVPIAAEVMMAMGIFDPRRVMGVTTLDVVRSKRFIAEINCVDPGSINIPVIGGHSGVTIIPVLSQSSSRVNLPELEIKKLTKRIQEAGTEVVKAKAGGGSATLSMAYAGAHFANSVLRGLAGEPNVVECVYVNSCVSEAAYFANPCVFGRCGIEMNLGYGCLNSYERELLQKAMPELIKNIQAGQAFVRKPNTK